MFEIMPRKAEVLVELVGFRGVYIGAVAVESFVRWRLRLANILVMWALQAVP